MKQILKYPNPILRKKSVKVTDFPDAKKIAEELIEVTRKVDSPFSIWLGMAAPQIGHNKRVIVIRKSYKNYQVMVNPQIVKRKWNSPFPLPSKCFSLKGLYLIKDHYWLKAKYYDLEGTIHTEVFKGGKASVLQQEINHLDGILLSDIGIRVM